MFERSPMLSTGRSLDVCRSLLHRWVCPGYGSRGRYAVGARKGRGCIAFQRDFVVDQTGFETFSACSIVSFSFHV